jgi:hypothetical protein
MVAHITHSAGPRKQHDRGIVAGGLLAFAERHPHYPANFKAWWDVQPPSHAAITGTQID